MLKSYTSIFSSVTAINVDNSTFFKLRLQVTLIFFFTLIISKNISSNFDTSLKNKNIYKCNCNL